MRKAIYLAVIMRLTPAGSETDRLPEIERRMGPYFQETPRHLVGTVKRIRSRGEQIEATVYFEGEQDAPANFATLAIDDIREVLNRAFVAPLDGNAHLTLIDIHEDTNAVDDLTDAGLLTG